MQKVIFLFITILFPLIAYSEVYTWKQVTPFPFYRVDHIVRGNSISFAWGRIIDSVDESSSDKKEMGTTPFFISSTDDKTWKRINPKIVAAGQTEELSLIKTFFVQGSFVSLAKNSAGKTKIYYSDSAQTWNPTNIDASSLTYINGHLIAEYNLNFSVSQDGKKWDTYSTDFSAGTGTANKNGTNNKTVSVIANDPSSVAFDSDSVRGFFVNDCYVLTDNDRTIAVSPDKVNWKVVERPLDENGTADEEVIGFVYGNKRFVYVTSSEDKEGSAYSSTDGKKWEKRSIDTKDYSKEYENFFPPLKYNELFPRDSVFYVKRIIQYDDGIEANGINVDQSSEWYVSRNGLEWKSEEDFYGATSNIQYPREKMPGEAKSAKLNTLKMRFHLGQNNVPEQVPLKAFFHLLFNKNHFFIPVDYYKTDYRSNDGYTWQFAKWDADSVLLYETDPYFKAKRTYTFLQVKEIQSGVKSYYIKISKDRQKWDTIYVDSLINKSKCFPELKKYSDGLILSCDKSFWSSSDGHTWSALNLKSATDSSRALAKINTDGQDRKIYIFADGTTKLSTASGAQWFSVVNKCTGANTVCWGDGRFVAAGERGKIWVLEKKY